MLFNIKRMRTWWPLATLITTLTLAGCSDDDRKGIITPDSLNQVGSGEMFHGAEWATIKNLDPRGEQCIDCHGKSADMSPNGKLAHNIGLQKNTDHSAYADLKITGVKVNETSGEVTVTLNQALPANAGNLSMTFAKLAPRVIHNRGHDWQNYFSTNATGRGGNEPKASFMPNGGVQPVTVPNPQVNGKTITFSLNSGEGRSFGAHDFQVKSAYVDDTAKWTYQAVKGTKIKMGDDLAKHIYCDAAYTVAASPGTNDSLQPANQTADKDGNLVACWWPDGTHLTAGTFVTTNDEFVVEYNLDQTHRVTIILGSTAGNPGFNAWYDFVPSVANGNKTPNQLNHADLSFIDVADYVKSDGSIVAADYKFLSGRGVIGGATTGNGAMDTESAKQQSLPAARDVVDVQSCNSCHDGLTMHGGSGRSQTQTCVTCHNPGNLQASSGRSVDFKQLIHRLHRGTDLPSEASAIAELMNDDTSLVAETATDFTKVRFPQGPTPGSAAGITNCVKCHMGAETKDMVQGLADELGAPNFDVASKMKLAKVTPQGDNWLSVRSVNACQACHDSNIWFAKENWQQNGANAVYVNKHRAGTITTFEDPEDARFELEKFAPFYSDKYSGVGYKWIGKKLKNSKEVGFLHTANSGTGHFTCGSGGGCHGNNAISTLAPTTVGNRPNTGNPPIQSAHLKLARDYILAERFEIRVKDVNVDANGFNVTAELVDKKNGNVIPNPAAHTDPDSGSLITFASNAMFGWMANGSPDYNHSAGGGFGSSFNGVNSSSAGQPGAPAGLKALTFDAQGEGSLTITWAEINAASGNNYNFDKDFDKASSFGTVAINTNMAIGSNNYRLRSANQDFSFADGMLAEGELARRQVVDFTAGSGHDANRDRYAGWDKEHGSNTQSCSSCHLKLDMHGATASNNTQMCVMCHNPNVTDLRARTKSNDMVEIGADDQYEESEDFKRLIHGVHAAAKFRIDPLQTRLAQRPNPNGAGGHSFPGVLSNCKSCHIQDEKTGQWTFELDQLPKGMIGSTMITADWATVPFAAKGTQHNLDNHLKRSEERR